MQCREIEERDTELGKAIYIKISVIGYRPLSWREVWGIFTAAYPGRWAVQVFPPRDQLVNGKAMYHLFVLDHEPEGLNIR